MVTTAASHNQAHGAAPSVVETLRAWSASFPASSRLARAAALFFALLFCSASASAQSLTAEVDKKEIGLNDVVTLVVTYEGGRAQIGSPEGADFVVRGQMTSSSSRQINNQMRTSITATFRLMPTRVGELTVGSVPVRTDRGALRTDPIAIVVKDAGASIGSGPASNNAAPQPNVAGGVTSPPVVPAARAGAAPIGAPSAGPPPPPASEQLLDVGIAQVGRGEPAMTARITSAQPIVGQQVVVDYVLLQPLGTFGLEQLDLSEPEFHDVWYQDISEARTRLSQGRLGRVNVGGTAFEANLVRSYAVVPLKEGELILPSVKFEVALQFVPGNARRLLEAPPIKLDVRPVPAEGRPAGFSSGNVGELVFTVALDKTLVRVGDALNLNMTVRGAGMPTAFVLPQMPEFGSMRTLVPDDTVDLEVLNSGWVTGTVRRNVTLIAEAEGTFTVPPITFHWYDPWAGKFQSQASDPLEVVVRGISPNAEANSVESELSADNKWLEGLPPQRVVSAGAQASVPIHKFPGFPLLVVCPTVALVLVEAASRWSQARKATAGVRTARSAAQTALARLQGKQTTAKVADVSDALRDFVGDKSGRGVRGLTPAELRKTLESHVSSAAASELAHIIERCDRARYGSEAESAAALVDAAINLIQRLEQEWK